MWGLRVALVLLAATSIAAVTQSDTARSAGWIPSEVGAVVASPTPIVDKVLLAVPTSTLPPAPTLVTTTPPYVEVEDGTFVIPFDHPTWGRSRLITRMDGMGGGSSIQVVDDSDTVRFEHVWTSLSYLGPLGAIIGDRPSLPPVDSRGHIFLQVCPNDCGTTVLVPTADGIDGAGLLGDNDHPLYLDRAGPFDEDGDGAYEIEQFVNDCQPSCADGTDTRVVYRWDGAGYSPDVELTILQFPFESFYDVPQLGAEPVRGSGCGGDGSLGDAVPDGWWYANIVAMSDDQVTLDVYCVYAGALGSQLYNDCVRRNPESPEDCNVGGPDWWPVNNSARTRTMPRSASMPMVVDYPGCYPMGESSVVHIGDGVVDYVRLQCGHS